MFLYKSISRLFNIFRWQFNFQVSISLYNLIIFFLIQMQSNIQLSSLFALLKLNIDNNSFFNEQVIIRKDIFTSGP